MPCDNNTSFAERLSWIQHQLWLLHNYGMYTCANTSCAPCHDEGILDYLGTACDAEELVIGMHCIDTPIPRCLDPCYLMALGLLPPAPKKYLWGWFFGVLEELWERFLGSGSDFWCLWGAFGVLLGGFGGHLGGFGRPLAVFWVASAGQRIHDNFFRHLGGSWCDFWCLRGAVGELLGAFWGHLGAFGWHVAVFFGFVSENVKL